MTMSAPFSYPEYRSIVGDYYGRKNDSVQAWQKSEQFYETAHVRSGRIRFCGR